MSAFSCCVRIEFDAAHRVMGHQNKCQYLHGHRYCLEVTASCQALNNLGMVVDFGILKSAIKKWIDAHLDHTTILCSQDHKLGDAISAITGQQIYYLPYNPTAENIARYLKENIFTKLFAEQDFTISAVLLRETPNCYALV